MPFLPVQNINTNAVDLGQGPSVARAGAEWEAVAAVGDKIQSFSAELGMKRREAEVKSFVSSMADDFERELSTKETELEDKYQDDPTGYASEMNEWMNEWHSQRIENAPNSDAKEMWEQRFGTISNKVGLQADARENKKRVEFQIRGMDDSVRKSAQHLANKPDPVKAAQFLSNHIERINDGVGLWYNENEAKERMTRDGEMLAKSYMDGLEASKMYGVGLNTFNGKDPNSQIILANMKPEHIASYKDRFKRLQEAENEFSKSMFNLEAGDLSLGLQQGIAVPQAKIQEMVARSASLKPEERKVYLDNLNTDIQYNSVLQKMKNLPVDEVRSLGGFRVAREANDIFNLKNRTERDEMFQKAAADILDKRVNNAPEYHYANDRDIQMLADMSEDFNNIDAVNAYTKSIVSKQAMDKVATPKIMTPKLSKSYSEMLKSPNPSMADNAYQALKRGMQVGNQNYSRNAVADMVRNGHLEPAHGMALSIEEPEARRSALQNLSKKKEINEQYDNLKKANSFSEKAESVLDDSSVNSFKSAIQNAYGEQSLNALNGFDELLVLEYKAGRIADLSASEAKKRAIKKVMKNNFAVAKAGNSQVILGAEHAKRKDDIEAFMHSSLSKETLKGVFKVQVDPVYAEKLGLVEKAGEAEDRYFSDLIRSGEWVVNDSQNGAVLYKKLAKGRAKVLDVDGNPISVSFDKMKDLRRKPEVKDKILFREGKF